MELTLEQKAILQTDGNLLINAVAGSGKTSTLIEYARTRPANSKILYIAFNKTVKEEAIRKFEKAGVKNVRVETAHSLAYQHIVQGSSYQLKNAYKTHELVQVLGLQGQAERHIEYIAANHILKFAAYFCNSAKEKVEELNYRDILSDEKAIGFVNSCYSYLEKQTRVFLSKMNAGKIEITHDFYLKKFQLSKPKLAYDYLLFDEGQDASEAMLHIFLNQEACKIIVGDTHQQIYGWRHAVNSLEKVDFPTLHLSTSFRFRQDIADLAKKIIQRKTLLDKNGEVTITGSGENNSLKTKAIVARSNLSLLLKAISHTQGKQKIKKLHFEGNFNSYTYAEDGTSLYDVLNLHLGKRGLVRDALVKEMKDLDELEEYIEKTEDAQLGMMLEVVKKYGSKIPGIIKEIKDLHVDQREDADLIFSTVHRCKGMEYDQVELADDFASQEDVEKLRDDKKATALQKSRMTEEINLLYVAITRTKNKLRIPDALLPTVFISSPNIEILAAPEEEEVPVQKSKNESRWDSRLEPKSKPFEESRRTYPGAYQPWTRRLDEELMEMHQGGATITELADYFERTRGAIRSRIDKLEVEGFYGF